MSEDEWTLLIGKPGQHLGVTPTRISEDTDRHIRVVPKSRLLSAEARCAALERGRDEANQLAHEYVLDNEKATDEVIALEARVAAYETALREIGTRLEKWVAMTLPEEVARDEAVALSSVPVSPSSSTKETR